MKTRFFYGKPTFKTWGKLFVLSEDGTFYCEYLNRYNPAIVQEKFDFSTFKASDYSWSGYQSIVEIDEETAKATKLTSQANWIEKYLNKINWVKDYLNKP